MEMPCLSYKLVARDRQGLLPYTGPVQQTFNLLRTNALQMVLRCCLILALCCLSGSPAKGNLHSLRFPFYSIEVQVSYTDELRNWRPPNALNLLFARPFEYLKQHQAHTLLDGITKARQEYALNDWLSLQLIQSAARVVLPKHSPAEQEILTAFLLRESGWDVILAGYGQTAQTYIYSEDQIAEVPFLEENGRAYYHLTRQGALAADSSMVYIVEPALPSDTRSFSMSLEKLPQLPEQCEMRQVSFFYAGNTHHLMLDIDRAVIDWVRDYPFVGHHHYLSAPPSTALQSSLLPGLRQLIQGKSQMEALDLLVAFTRSAFAYKTDEEAYGREKPMIPEELFFYPFSDCEDRSALLFALIRALLPLPAIAVSNADHVSIAVDLPGLKGEHIPYRGRDYVVCDPTGPNRVSLFQANPPVFSNEPYDVILTFIPVR